MPKFSHPIDGLSLEPEKKLDGLTKLIVNVEHYGLLDDYFAIARVLQPALVQAGRRCLTLGILLAQSEIAESKIAQRRDYPACILGAHLNPHVEIFRVTRMSVHGNSITADHQITTPLAFNDATNSLKSRESFI